MDLVVSRATKAIRCVVPGASGQRSMRMRAHESCALACVACYCEVALEMRRSRIIYSMHTVYMYDIALLQISVSIGLRCVCKEICCVL